MAESYECWNDTTVAGIFLILIKKNRNPYETSDIINVNFEEYQNYYNALKGYIEWHDTNCYLEKFSLYNFTQENMHRIFNKLDYNVNNKEELLTLWRNTMIRLVKTKD